MRVELLVNLRCRAGEKQTKIWRKGVYSDPIPPAILGEVKAGAATVRVLDDPVPNVAAEKPQAAATETGNEISDPPDADLGVNTIEEEARSAGLLNDESVAPVEKQVDVIIEQTRYPKLHALIKLKGSVAETARVLGVSAATVHSWKNGKTKPQKSMIAKISRMVRHDERRADDTGDAGSQGPEQQPEQ